MTMTTPPARRQGPVSQERSAKVTDLRAPLFDEQRAQSLLELAKGATRRGEHALASRLYARALEKDDGDIEATIGLAASQLMEGKGAAAEELAKRALDLAPTSPEPRLILANLRIAQDRYQEAIEYLKESITVDPKFALGFSRLGTILTAVGENAAAEPILLRALALDPTDADALNSIGNVVLARNDVKGAALHFERAVAANPGWLQPRMNLASAFERLDRLDDAIDALEDALIQEPRNIEAKVYLAGLLHRVGNLGRAEITLDDVIEAQPNHPGALFLAGLVRIQDERPNDAVDFLERAAVLAPDSADVSVNLVSAYREAGRLEEALPVARRAAARHPETAAVLNALGSVLLDLDQRAEAAEMFRKTIANDPTFHIAHVNLASALLGLSGATEAISLLEQALKLGASPTAVYRTLGLAHREVGNLEPAEANLRRAVEQDPNDDKALYALAAVLEMVGRARDARPVADALVARDPGLVHAHVVRSLTAPSNEDALMCISKVLALAPDSIDALMVAGTLNDSASRPEEALRHYRRVLELQPDHRKARVRCTDIVLSLGDFAQREGLVRELQAALDGHIDTSGLDIFNLQALDIDYAAIAKAARVASGAIERGLETNESDLWVPRVASKGARIRVGYLLPYTWFHSLPMVLRHIVKAHDRSAFDVVGFTMQSGKREDEFERTYKAAFDEFHNLVGLSPKQAAARIGAAGIDILIEVSGHTSISCLPIAAYRPAPVQAHLLGYSITTGARFIDYLITDEIYIPRDQAEMGTEKAVYMPNSFMPALPQPVAAGSIRRAELNLPEDAFVLANFNHPCKFEPGIFDAWMSILQRVPNAVMWFGHWFEATSANLRREAAARGIEGERLIFAPIAEHADHLRRLTQADLAVDNRLHGGGITTIDALWAGLPVLTVAGDTPSSRLGATLLNGIEMPDMVTPSLEAYVDKAVSLAEDPSAMSAVRERLKRNRETAPLFDFPRYVHDLERAYTAIWQRHEAGLPPQLVDLKETG
jgi:protein O-GlcNAc transferase